MSGMIHVGIIDFGNGVVRHFRSVRSAAIFLDMSRQVFYDRLRRGVWVSRDGFIIMKVG